MRMQYIVIYQVDYKIMHLAGIYSVLLFSHLTHPYDAVRGHRTGSNK